MLGMDGSLIISSKRELVQVAGYSQVNLQAKYNTYLWLNENLYSKNYENSNPRKPIQGIKLSELQKSSCFKLKIIMLTI